MDRRAFLAGGIGAGGLVATQAVNAKPLFDDVSIRGSIDATQFGIRPGTYDDQSETFGRLINQAATDKQAIYLPAGDYVVSNITLPKMVQIIGVPDATRIIYGGNGFLFAAQNTDLVFLSGLTIDGANGFIGEHSNAIVDLRNARRINLDRCVVSGSNKHGVYLEGCAGHISQCRIAGAAEAAIYAVQSNGLNVESNVIERCGNGGIWVHRWQEGVDGTIVTGNRISDIGANHGGTGQWGNGINVFRAGNVVISNNVIDKCAFSAIRSNGGSNVQISSNTCTNSGETALYSEFAFEGAIIANNLVDGAANGISVVNFNEGGRLAVVNGNVVRNLTTKGPYQTQPPGFGAGISVEADTSVTGNVVEGAPLYGISVGWGEYMRNVVVSGNVIRQVGTGVAVSVADGARSAVISDNIIQQAKLGGIVGYRWADAATADLAIDASGVPDTLTIARNHVG